MDRDTRKVHGVVKYVHSSPQRRDAFVKACTCNTRLPIPNIETRWNSTIGLLSQAFEKTFLLTIIYLTNSHF